MKLVFFLLAVQINFAQPFYFPVDSLSFIKLSTSYFDLLRTTNSTSTTTSFLQKTSAEFQTSSKTNKFYLSLETEKNRLKIDNSVSHVEFNTGQYINRITTDYEFSFDPFFAELYLRGNQIKSVSTIDYGGSIGFVDAYHWFEKFRVGYYSYSFPWIFGLKYIDSEIDINNLTQLSKIIYNVSLHPTEQNRLSIQYEKYLSAKNKNENPVFAVEDETASSFTNLTFSNSSLFVPIEVNYSHAQGETFFDFIYAQNSFSSSSFKNVLYNGISVKSLESDEFIWLPAFSVGYDFYKGSAVGNIQSWPFTSVLTSLIANRINYRLAGHLYLLTIQMEKQFRFSKFSITPGLSIYQILPEVTLDNWQPSYLVFGVKDFTRNILPIRKAIIGKLKLSASYQFNAYTLILECGQFVPLKVVKKELPSSGVTPGIVTTQAKPSKVDGGRWLSLSLTAGF